MLRRRRILRAGVSAQTYENLRRLHARRIKSAGRIQSASSAGFGRSDGAFVVGPTARRNGAHSRRKRHKTGTSAGRRTQGQKIQLCNGYSVSSVDRQRSARFRFTRVRRNVHKRICRTGRRKKTHDVGSGGSGCKRRASR